MSRVRLLGEFTKSDGRADLHVRLYRESHGYVYERELVEKDDETAVDTTMVLPFTAPQLLRRFISADPYCSLLRIENNKLLKLLEEDIDGENSH